MSAPRLGPRRLWRWARTCHEHGWSWWLIVATVPKVVRYELGRGGES